MTIYDAAMVAVVVAGMVWGAWRGITWQLASMASLVLGYLVAHPLSSQIATQFPGPPIVARALAMLAVYAAVSGGVFLAAWLVRTTLRQLKFEAFDRHLGMVLGGLEGATLGLVVTLFTVSLAPQSRDPIFTSKTGVLVGRLMNTLGPVLPGEVRDELAPFWASASGTLTADSSAVPASKGSSASLDKVTDSFQSLLEEGEKRVGKAVVETAEKELKRTGAANVGNVERR